MAAEQRIPVYTNLNDLYGNLGSTLNHAVRWDHLSQEFVKRFGRKPSYIARAPGRVNLIGEHIDYALFGVLPAAVEHDILIACGPRPVVLHSPEPEHGPGSVIAENLHTKYKREVFSPSQKTGDGSNISEEQVHAEGWHLDINTQELRWESYVKAGYYGVLTRYFHPNTSNEGSERNLPVPVDLLVTGTVPAGSGLSSSAAMVVASTLAFLAVNRKLDDDTNDKNPTSYITKGELVKMAVENEKRVGVNSGGMDQAASVVSDRSSALYITFYPSLNASPVRLPDKAVFVCANSLVISDKAVTAKWRYNLRVVETLVGARILSRKLQIPVGENEKITYREVIGRYAGEKPGEDMGIDKLAEVLETMVNEKVDLLRPTGYDLGVTMEEMIELSGLPKEVFEEVYLSWVEIEATRFQLYKRARHVFSEALRVLKFRQICIDAADAAGSFNAEQQIGDLMNESQSSCAELFECSCPEVDELTRLAREAGAYGSRVTGAGWGGCTVSLVPESEVDSFIKKIRDTYGPYKGLEGDALNEVIFATRPSSGACVYKLD